MDKKTCKTLISNQGALVGLVLALLALMTYCGSGKKWTEVQSFTIENRTISSGHRFRLEPVKEGKALIKNIGIFEATFVCTRLEGKEEVSYTTESHFKSRATGKGRLGVDKTMSSFKKNQWPAGTNTQEIKMMCPFFPWEVKSTKEGDVYFYMRDGEDGTVVSNIILIPVKIKARSE